MSHIEDTDFNKAPKGRRPIPPPEALIQNAILLLRAGHSYSSIVTVWQRNGYTASKRTQQYYLSDIKEALVTTGILPRDTPNGSVGLESTLRHRRNHGVYRYVIELMTHRSVASRVLGVDESSLQKLGKTPDQEETKAVISNNTQFGGKGKKPPSNSAQKHKASGSVSQLQNGFIHTSAKSNELTPQETGLNYGQVGSNIDQRSDLFMGDMEEVNGSYQDNDKELTNNTGSENFNNNVNAWSSDQAQFANSFSQTAYHSTTSQSFGSYASSFVGGDSYKVPNNLDEYIQQLYQTHITDTSPSLLWSDGSSQDSRALSSFGDMNPDLQHSLPVHYNFNSSSIASHYSHHHEGYATEDMDHENSNGSSHATLRPQPISQELKSMEICQDHSRLSSLGSRYPQTFDVSHQEYQLPRHGPDASSRDEEIPMDMNEMYDYILPPKIPSMDSSWQDIGQSDDKEVSSLLSKEFRRLSEPSRMPNPAGQHQGYATNGEDSQMFTMDNINPPHHVTRPNLNQDSAHNDCNNPIPCAAKTHPITIPSGHGQSTKLRKHGDLRLATGFDVHLGGCPALEVSDKEFLVSYFEAPRSQRDAFCRQWTAQQQQPTAPTYTNM